MSTGVGCTKAKEYSNTWGVGCSNHKDIKLGEFKDRFFTADECHAECKKNKKCFSFGLGMTNRINDCVLFSKGCKTEINYNWDHYEMNDCQGKI